MLVGLELLFNSVKEDIRTKEDVLIIAIHCLLIQDGMKCIGTGDEVPPGNQKGSELLPKNWNRNLEVYTLHYVNSDNSLRILFKAVKSGKQLLLNLLNMNTNAASALSLTVSDFISDHFTELDTAFINLEELKTLFVSNALKEVKPAPPPQPTASSSQEQGNRRDDTDPLRVYPPYRPCASAAVRPNRNPYNVGASDLDPLGRGIGGGMLMDPRHPLFGPHANPNPGIGIPERLPRGAVPPGARFDPFGPIDPNLGPRSGNRFAEPDPDHLPPPGYDDMFM